MKKKKNYYNANVCHICGDEFTKWCDQKKMLQVLEKNMQITKKLEIIVITQENIEVQHIVSVI